MKKSEFEAGSYLYKLHGNYKKDDQRVFIHTGYITADGYGVMLGFLEDGTLCKSSGHGNYQYGNDVRYATQDEIDNFINEVLYYPQNIKPY